MITTRSHYRPNDPKWYTFSVLFSSWFFVHFVQLSMICFESMKFDLTSLKSTCWTFIFIDCVLILHFALTLNHLASFSLVFVHFECLHTSTHYGEPVQLIVRFQPIQLWLRFAWSLLHAYFVWKWWPNRQEFTYDCLYDDWLRIIIIRDNPEELRSQWITFHMAHNWFKSVL